jgi:uroporphyrin-III C-methyltransferase
VVYLVGAGPGDPELITVRGLRALRSADVVLYDRLANPALLAEAPAWAELVDVGKRPRDPQQTKQDFINDLLVRYGKAHSAVVRLKGGDPYVYGRGGEEAMALRAAGVSFEVIPGVSSAIAAPAAAGIPVTHRGVANGFAVFSGHEAEGGTSDGIAWEAAVAIPTAVFLMGVERLPHIVAKLREHGAPDSRPVAIVSRGTLPDQVMVSGVLGNIVEKAEGVEAPAVIVVGDVVALEGIRE